MNLLCGASIFFVFVVTIDITTKMCIIINVTIMVTTEIK